MPVFSQVYTISGSLNNLDSKVPLTGAHISLVKGADSLVLATISTGTGRFSLDRVKPGSYTIKFSHVGYENHAGLVQVSDRNINLGSIGMVISSTGIREVSVTHLVPLATQIGDTIQFNAEAFTTMPDATAEDLVEKLPGVTVEDGKVEAMGEEVKQVLVDGRPFFRDDPTAALRTLPAEVIDKIQIFDKESDQAEFTGFSTGETQKAMNIITKANMRNGFFGKAYGGAGVADPTLTTDYDPKYAGGVNLNWFNGARRITLVAQTNNINQQNFMMEDLLGVMASGQRGSAGGMGSRGGGSMGGRIGGTGDRSGGMGGQSGGRMSGPGGSNISDFMVGQQPGISTTHSVGINYSDLWRENVDVTGSYFFNLSDNNSLERLSRNYILGADSGQVYRELSNTDSRNSNHRANLRLQWNINENNSVFIRPRLTIQENNGLSSFLGETLKAGSLLNEIDNDNRSELSAVNFSNTLLYRHRFSKERRSATVNFTSGYNDQNGDMNMNAIANYLTPPLFTEIIDEHSILLATGWSYSGGLMYSEPLGANSTVMLSYGASYRKDDSRQETYNYFDPDQDYTELDTLTSNVFHNNYISQNVGGSYLYRKDKIMFTGRLQYQSSRLNNRQVFPSEFDMEKNFHNLLVNTVLRYRPSRQQNLNLVYRTSTRPPSIDQLQEVLDNSNPLQLLTGNSDLSETYTHTAFFRYSKINIESYNVFFAMLHGSYSNNYIANSTFLALKDTLLPSGILVKEGTQLSYPVNLDNNWSIRSFITYGMPVSGLKSNLNMNLGINYSNRPSLANDVLNYMHNASITGGLVLASNISEYVDFTVSLRSNYNFVRNTVNTTQNNNYYDQRTRFRFKGVLPSSGWFAETLLTNRFYDGLSEDYDQNYWLWNAAIGRKLFKNHLGEIKLGVYDVLNQNQSIQRMVYDIYVDDVQNNILQRYFMFTFAYNIRYFRGSEPGNRPEDDFRQKMRKLRDEMN